MVESTWDDRFFSEEIEAADPGNGVIVWYLGCNGFVLHSASTTLYVDPYFGSGDPPNIVRMIPVPMDPEDATDCDGVLVTHEHIDHIHPPSYGPLVDGCGVDLYAPAASYDSPDHDGDLDAPAERRNTIAAGEDFAANEATDFLRADPEYDAGITGAMKMAHMAEAYGLDVESHAPGPAQRHCIAACRNSNYYEMALVHPHCQNT